MNCRGVSRRLSAFIDGQLSPAIREAVEDHLKGCLLCRRKLAEIEAIVRVTREMQTLRVSEGFADRVIEASKENSLKKEALAKIGYRFGLASAAFMAAAAAIFFIFGPVTSVNDHLTRKIDNNSNTIPIALENVDTLNFADNPNLVVYTVPVPEDILEREKMLDDSLLQADTTSKIDQFVYPQVDRSIQVNKVYEEF